MIMFTTFSGYRTPMDLYLSPIMCLELHAQIHVVKKTISFRYLLSTSCPTLDKIVGTVENEKKKT
jgi:hypothetical protein